MSSQALIAVEIERVAESWTQNEASFLHSLTPSGFVRDSRSLVKTTTYQLPDLANTLADGDGMMHWRPGTDPGEDKPLAYSPKTITPQGYANIGFDQRDLPGPGAPWQPLVRDLENNIVPLQLSRASGSVDRKIVALLQSSAFGSAKTFTNGGSALDAPSDYANQAPDLDINTNLRALTKWMSLGFSLECWTTSNVLQVLARHPVYTGAGTGSARPTSTPVDEFAEIFRRLHGLDRIIVADSLVNTARQGQTASARRTANTLLWFGLVDRRAWDLVDPNSPDAPDGAIQIAWGCKPYVANWRPEGLEVERFQARASFDVFSPRGSDFGFYFQATGAGGIFTSAPT